MGLSSVATPIWNEIARTQKLRTTWAKKAFAMSSSAQDELENQEYKELKAKVGHEVAAAFSDLKPLLLENAAISRYIRAQGDLTLRQALPEVVSIAEAVAIASMDRPLSRMEQTSLANLLKAECRDPSEYEPNPISPGLDVITTANADLETAVDQLGKLFSDSGVDKGST
jgi:hypothetical protein